MPIREEHGQRAQGARPAGVHNFDSECTKTQCTIRLRKYEVAMHNFDSQGNERERKQGCFRVSAQPTKRTWDNMAQISHGGAYEEGNTG